VGEDLVEALFAGDAGHRRDIRGQRDSRQCALAHDHRMDELHSYMLGIGTGCAVTEDHQGAPSMESHRHRMAGGGDLRSFISEMV
jgi:hypothetical protein